MGNADSKAGITTGQIKAAAVGSVFVWGSDDLEYPMRLAIELSREDLHIVGPSWLRAWLWSDQQYTGIVIDHRARLSPRELDAFFEIKRSWRPACPRSPPPVRELAVVLKSKGSIAAVKMGHAIEGETRA